MMAAYMGMVMLAEVVTAPVRARVLPASVMHGLEYAAQPAGSSTLTVGAEL